MNRACSRSRLRNPLLFTPLNLFSIGEQGAWYDPSDMATLFQDDAGTVPVTAADQVVGRILDKSGRGNHATQVTEASKPILRISGGLSWLEFDGVDDFMVTGSVSFTTTSSVSVFSGVRKITDATTGCLCELSIDSGSNVGAFALMAPNFTAEASYGWRVRLGASVSRSGTPFAAPRSDVLTAYATANTPIVLRVTGTEFVGASPGSGSFGDFPIYIGRRAGTSLPSRINLFGLIIRGAISDGSAISATEQYLAIKSGVSL